MSAEVHNGDVLMTEYTPGTAVTAGDIVVVGSEPWVAHRDIAANMLGALAVPSCSAIYRVTLAASASFTAGADVFVDGSGDAAAAGTLFGTAVAAADQGAGDTVVLARHGKAAAS